MLCISVLKRYPLILLKSFYQGGGEFYVLIIVGIFMLQFNVENLLNKKPKVYLFHSGKTHNNNLLLMDYQLG